MAMFRAGFLLAALLLCSVLAGRFEVRPLAYDAYAANANDVAVKIAENVRAQSGATDIDAFVVVSTGLVDIQTAGSRERCSGLGITDHGRVLVPKIELYALYDITVVDAHDLSVVTSTQSVFGGPSLGARAWREVDESWMPATLDATQNMRLKGAVTEVLDRTLPVTIESLKLLQ